VKRQNDARGGKKELKIKRFVFAGPPVAGASMVLVMKYQYWHLTLRSNCATRIVALSKLGETPVQSSPGFATTVILRRAD
jgi:hypothetical protein